MVSTATPPRPRLPRTATVAVSGLGLVAAGLGLTGCRSTPPPATAAPTASAEPSPDPANPATARATLAARAAAAQDRREVVVYQLQQRGYRPRTVVLTRAADGGWRADIAAGALGGTADVAVVRSRQGLYQCALGSATQPAAARCAEVGGPRDRLPAAADPQVQRVFVESLEILTDRQPAIAVTPATAPPGVEGDCWSVQSNSASLPAAVDVGVYCYRADGLLTGGRWSFGTLALAGDPTHAPDRVILPGPVAGDPLPMDAPRRPSATPTPR
ncbi:hypothetical protein GCM10010124_40840 [Pilimelia terevasa]|uniref:Uncharacterized protein n=1 Tax=Pilimelia terevasa TaxID=53372 RepID=A0A8J3BSA6_9ACTN|nr:hypothetical protein [Pilimelia terevasa]GGK43858.1 hypothetical protein GCM10010124_40840 [Pilimelia terevasa]